MAGKVLIRGGGDLASGVALRLIRAEINVVITELAQPLVVRRMAAFAEAVYANKIAVEGVYARYIENYGGVNEVLERGEIPVMVDPQASVLVDLKPLTLIDARMTKQHDGISLDSVPLIIGLGPGFVVGDNCHVVIETKRGQSLGRVIREGSAEVDTGIPEAVGKYQIDRVLRAPKNGDLRTKKEICDQIQKDQVIAEVDGAEVRASFNGILRGLLHNGFSVTAGQKIGDLDPRHDPNLCTHVSDKALAVGGGVLEAILSQADIRSKLWD